MPIIKILIEILSLNVLLADAFSTRYVSIPSAKIIAIRYYFFFSPKISAQENGTTPLAALMTSCVWYSVKIIVQLYLSRVLLCFINAVVSVSVFRVICPCVLAVTGENENSF